MVRDLLMLFFVYSLFGWIGETVFNSLKHKRFVNRGFFNGPFCFIYGFSAVLMSIVFNELLGEPVTLFIGCTVLATAVEWFTGKFLERMNHQKWWDYSNKKWNFDGYICLQYSLLWGALGTIALMFTNGLLVRIFHLLPSVLRTILIWFIVVVAVIDGIASWAVMTKYSKGMETIFRMNDSIDRWTYRFGMWIVSRVSGRMEKAYPLIAKGKAREKTESAVFAEGCGFYKIFWLFILGAFLGDIVETIFCRVTAGIWMSRSSLVWGPFSLVWGFAIAMATILLYKDKDKPDRFIFFVGTFLGGVYEYACSVFTEIVFGKVFWDYSKIPFNIGGRINLLYCFFWGIAAVVWIKVLYPVMSRWIEKVPMTIGKIATWIAVVFMVVNIAVSMLALIRYDSRAKGLPAQSGWEESMDIHFDDARMERIYPNAIQR